MRGGSATPTLRGKFGSLRGGTASTDTPRGEKIYASMGAIAPGGPGSTLEGITEIELAGKVRISTCVPKRKRGLRRRDIILVEKKEIGSLPKIECRVLENALSATNISGEVRTESGCNTGEPGTTGGWWGLAVGCVYNTLGVCVCL